MVGCDAEILISLMEERRLIYDFSMKNIATEEFKINWEEILTYMDVSGKYLFIF
jgi:hypothetical protein